MFEKKFRMNRAILSLGTNIGEKSTNLSAAVELLAAIPCTVKNKSSIYRTAAWGNTDQPSFFNQVIAIETEYDAFMLMDKILGIENKMGRVRNRKWEPRIIDIDILFFNEEIINSERLVIPHPHLHERRFVLEPLHELFPGLMHPVLQQTVSRLHDAVADSAPVEKLNMIPQE